MNVPAQFWQWDFILALNSRFTGNSDNCTPTKTLFSLIIPKDVCPELCPETAEQEMLANSKCHQKGPVLSHYENTTQEDLYFSFFLLIITCNSYYKTNVGFPLDSIWVENTFLSCKAGNALLTQNLAILFRYSAQTITPPHPQMHQVHSRYACKAWFLCSFCHQLLIL